MTVVKLPTRCDKAAEILGSPGTKRNVCGKSTREEFVTMRRDPRKAAELSNGNANVKELAQCWKLNSGVGFLIRLMESRYGTLYQTFTKQDEITPPQFGVLIALYQSGPLTLTDLATTIRTDRSTLGEMINRMVKRKFVSKRSNGKDGRSFEVSLSASGRATLLRIVGGAAQLQTAFLSPIPPEDRAQFLRNLGLVAFGE